MTTLNELNNRASLAAFTYCANCDALLTEADDKARQCTQCEFPLSRLRRLIRKIALAHVYDPGETDLDDEQPVGLTIDLGDVRLARRLLREP